jgi:nicotinate-nucleotide pyrophosphorylase (carboxylating)
VSAPARVRDALEAAGLDVDGVADLVARALAEDLRDGPDVTTEATVAATTIATGDVVARARGVVAGVAVARAVLDAVAFPPDGVTVVRDDGERVEPGDVVVTLRGPLRPLLVAERTLLNVLTHLSGVATATRAWVDALAGTGCVVRDTRKTLPGLRDLEKYAVRCGGGRNHRRSLGDAALIKDNHVAAAGGVAAAVRAVLERAPDVVVEVECDTLDQVREALGAGARLVLLDNMDLDQLRAAVALARRGPAVALEASGGLTLAGARAVAETGVDFVAVGALTHSSPALDLGLDLRA